MDGEDIHKRVAIRDRRGFPLVALFVAVGLA